MEILTITLNPSVDKNASVEGIEPEKKLRCTAPKYEPGGGGINVSRALKRLGTEAETFFVSGGRTGDLLENLIEKEDIKIHPFKVSNETRENFIVQDSITEKQFRFGFPGETITAEDQNNILKSFDNIFPKWVVISGSLPQDVSSDFLIGIIRIFKNKNSKIIVDTSGEALMKTAEEGVFLIKPNIGELATLTDKKELDENSIENSAREIIKNRKADIVVVSMGGKGAFLFSETEKIFVGAPKVEVKSTVGAGDSMVAGMVSALSKNKSLREILKLSIACGSATTMVNGTGLFNKSDVDKLLGKVKREM